MICSKFNSIYFIECEKDSCKLRYLGKTQIRNRIADHWGYIINKNLDRATGAHFILLAHFLNNMKFTNLEKVKSYDEKYRRRKKYIKKKSI